MLFPGWTIARDIPSTVWAGLLTGQYNLTGGVIRWATGTAKGGQIVAHLLPAAINPLGSISGFNLIPGFVSNIQLMQLSSQVKTLSQVTQQVLNLMTGTAVLAGLNLAVSCLGFSFINNKLNTIDDRLKEIQKDVHAIKYFLEGAERAKLYAALNALLKIDETTAPEHRHTILHTSKNSLAEINMHYKERLSTANTIETIMATEEYFSLTAVAQARCTAELGMLKMARQELAELNTFWKTQARRIAKDVLIGQYPERFLASAFAEAVTVSMLAEWLDFAYDEEKGYAWIDQIRRKIDAPWYYQFPLLTTITGKGSGLSQNIGVGLEKEKEIIIPALQKFVARNNLFDGYAAQYEMLETYNMKPSEFECKLAELPAAEAVNGYFILEPGPKRSPKIIVKNEQKLPV